jgi:polysaccharide biosynthesis/export protein
MKIGVGLICLFYFASAAQTQNILPPIGPQAELPPVSVLPPQRLGVGDLVNISVYAAPELSRPVRIGNDGKVRIPMVAEPIPAVQEMPDELAASIARELKAEKIMVDPLVTVTVTEYMSRPVSVTGAVHHPITFQAYGEVSLLTAISKADGLTQDAGPYLFVSFPPGPDGSPGMPPQQISIRSLMDGTDPSLNLRFHGGEDVRIPEAQRIYVLGNVKKPGAYAVQDAPTTSVMKALALSEGVLPFATKEAYIYRSVPGKTERQEIPVQLQAIIQRKSPDLPLQGGDIFYIPDNHGKRLTANVLERITGFGSTTMSGVLIWH